MPRYFPATFIVYYRFTGDAGVSLFHARRFFAEQQQIARCYVSFTRPPSPPPALFLPNNVWQFGRLFKATTDGFLMAASGYVVHRSSFLAVYHGKRRALDVVDTWSINM